MIVFLKVCANVFSIVGMILFSAGVLTTYLKENYNMSNKLLTIACVFGVLTGFMKGYIFLPKVQSYFGVLVFVFAWGFWWIQKSYMETQKINLKRTLVIMMIALVFVLACAKLSKNDSKENPFDKNPNNWTQEDKDYVNNFFEWHHEQYD